MRSIFNIPLVALVLLGTSHQANAQEISYGIKFGGGMALTGGIEAQNSRGALNFAVTGDYKLSLIGPKDELFAELGYKYWKADWKDRTRLTNKPAGYGDFNFWTGVGYTPTGTGHIFNQDPASATRGSVDMRHDVLEGWGLTLGYRYNFPDTNFYAHAGLTVFSMIYQQEVLGELRVYDRIPTVPAATAGTPVLVHREGLNHTPAANSVSPGFFVGAQWRLDKHFFTEVNLGWMSYSTVEYQPFVYTGATAHTTTGSDSKVTLDFCIGLRF
ncbi:MAG: hypothetical protein FWG02_01785 [Holophagaceae bacterium]|nr:hypothetical protein [Holophagaceae bacterium]